MSDKIQHTAARLREKMVSRYSDGLPHKHNKIHVPYRLHFKSHPCNTLDSPEPNSDVNCSTGLVREFKLRKIRKRLDKGRIH